MSRVKKATGNRDRTDREKLELFLRKVEELAERNLAQKGIRTEFGYSANTTSDFNMRLTQPDEEEVYAFLPTFRQFISDKEPVFLSHIYKICLRWLVDDELKELVRGSQEIWKKTQAVSGIELVVNGEKISGIKAAKIWIYGKCFHTDLEYEQILVKASPEELKLLRFNFISFVGRTSTCIQWLDGFIFKALKENKFVFDISGG